MALTVQERETCRDILAEENFKLVTQGDEVVSTNNSLMTRYIDGIGEPLQDQCQQFLRTFVSAENPEVVEISGTTEPYDVSGEYFGTGSVVNEEVQRKSYGGDYWLEASESGGNYRWIIRNEWDDVLYRSQEQASEPVEIDDAIWEAVEVSFEYSVERADMIVPLVAVVTGDTATFTSTGAITSAISLPEQGIYATITDPLADIQVRDGLWRGGRVWTEKQNNGTFTLFQSLYVLNESNAYILAGKSVTDYHTEERRLYERIPEPNVNALVNSLASLSGYTIVDVDVRMSNNRGIYNVYLRLREYTGPEDSVSSPRLVGFSGGLFGSYVYQIRNVAEADLTSVITELESLDLIQNVTARASSNEGYWDVTYSVLVLPDVRTEIEIGYERREGGSGAVSWTYYNDFAAQRDSDGNVNDWILYQNRKATSYNQSPTWREVEVRNVISYSASDPGNLTNSFDGPTGTSVGGRKRVLQNGLWEKQQTTIIKLWWPY